MGDIDYSKFACITIEDGRPHLKISSVDRRRIFSQEIINGRLITEILGRDLDYPAGTLVCEMFNDDDRDKYKTKYGPEYWDYAAGETVTRLGKVFWDLGVFTPRV